jgi:hypothetical protein
MTNVGSATIGQAVLPNLTVPVVPQLQNLDLVIKVAGDAKSSAPIGGDFWAGNEGVTVGHINAMKGKLQNLDTTTLLVGGNLDSTSPIGGIYV